MTLLLISAACAQAPPASSIRAALDHGMATAEAASSVRCTREPEKLVFSCIEQIDQDHFTAVDVVAEPIAPDQRKPGRQSIHASEPIVGPGGGGGRYSLTTADGAYAIQAIELQRLMRGARPNLPSATSLIEVIATTYDGKPATR
ncbi:hypothetical protein ACBY01_17140 [Sphingomonas sp. ac-8]|uniref:hypothetical protein n=1 Tax=Sphingomonas sp. ac-8 TaxID=3242977 RepID=UPI003A7FF41F